MAIDPREPALATNTTNKWFWKMQYCQMNGLPPAQSWVWDRAEEAYEAKMKEIQEERKQ